MRVLAFGTYERRYPRNAQVVSALRGAGVEVHERHLPVWDGREHKFGAGLASAARLGLAEARLFARRPSEPFDVVLVGYPGHADLAAARRAARGRPIVFNPLVSLWDTLVEDRARFDRRSLAARALRRLDRAALGSADLVVADTEQHAELFRELGARRVEVCFVGAEERLFKPGWRGGERFLFVGKLIPLHGLETILAAARLTPELRLNVVGSGQEQRLLQHDRPANVDWTTWLAYEQLPAVLRGSRAALGIFGTSAKARRVIPNKAFQALATGTPLITADTPAIRELLADEQALLVPPGDPDALAAALRRLAADDELAHRVGAKGHAVYRERASEQVLGTRWRTLLEDLL